MPKLSEKGIIQLIVLLILIVGLVTGLFLIQKTQIFKPKAANTGTRLEFAGSSVSGDKTTSRDVKLKIYYVGSPRSTSSPSSQTPSPGITIKDSYSPKVLLLIFNPKMPDGRKLSEYYAWKDPDQLTATFINDVRSSSHALVNYSVVERKELDKFPLITDGFRYDGNSYASCVNSGGGNCHNPDLSDYRAFIDEVDACGKRNRGEIDELWVWGGPWFGYYESNLAGTNAFWYNSSPTSGTSCNKLLPIMGFNYERGEAEMFEDLGHRTESTMIKVYGSWEANENHAWNKFSLLDVDKPGRGGCGNAHLAVNAASNSGYDTGNSRTVKSRCDDFLNYPNLKDQFTDISCNAWDCSYLGYFKWLFSHLPHVSGVGSDGKYNNWWGYVVDPQNTIVGSVKAVAAYAQEAFPTDIRLANSESELASAPDIAFTGNPTEVDWQLTAGNGQKTVYAQFKINGSWGNKVSASIELIESTAPPVGPGTSLTFSANKGQYNVGDEVAIQVVAHSDTTAANLFDAKINYDANYLKLGRVDVSSPFIKNWVEQYWSDPGKISLVGAVPNPGFQTKAQDTPVMATLHFTALKAGSTTVSFDETSAIYSNTDNTNILANKGSLALSLGSQPASPTPQPTVTSTPTPATTASPTLSPSPIATPTPGTGDANGDGKINLVDLSILLSDFNKTSGFRPGIDLKRDGKVNSFDFSLMRNLLIANKVIRN